MATLNQFGGVAGGIASEPRGVMPYGGSVGGGGGFANYPGIPSAGVANATNLAYTRSGMAGDPAYAAALGFLNPNDPTAMRDVATHAAEHAVGGGMSGSGVAGQYAGRLRESDIERRAVLGNQLLSGTYGRTPPPVNPYAATSLAGTFANEDANRQNQILLSQIHDRYAPSGGGGGGGRSAPMVVGGGRGGMGGGFEAPPELGGGGGGSLFANMNWQDPYDESTNPDMSSYTGQEDWTNPDFYPE